MSHLQIIFLACLLSCLACGAQSTADRTEHLRQQASHMEQIMPDTFDCRLHGMQLEGATHWMADKQMLFAIAAQGADISGSQPHYRTFQVYTTQDCNMISYMHMAGNRDHAPSLLQANTYESENELVCAQGYEFTFCFDVEYREFLTPLPPMYRRPRGPSKEGGTPQGLAIRDNVLFGSAAQHGCWAYDMSNKKNPKPILPAAEFIDATIRQASQLFIISGETADQVIIPQMKNGKLILQPQWSGPEKLLPRMTPDRRSGRYAMARTKESDKPLLFDLSVAKRLDLPKDIESTTDVLNYIDKKLY